MENSQYINYHILPKLFSWPQLTILKIACGPTHILLVYKDSTNETKIGALGNGTYGKLGNNSEDRDNAFVPVTVDFQNIEELTKSEKGKEIHIRCSRFTSCALIQSKNDVKANRVFLWGAGYRALFDQHKVSELIKKNIKNKIKLASDMIELKGPMEVTSLKAIKKVALSDYSIYFLLENKQIRSAGKFFINDKTFGTHTQQFSRISIGLNHGAGITFDHRLMTWGFNIMNKLGFEQKYDDGKFGEVTTFNEIDDKFYYDPTNVEEFNKLFKNENPTQIDNNNNNTPNNVNNKKVDSKETPTPTANGDKDKDKKKKEQGEINTDNIITETQGILQNKYVEYEKKIQDNEKTFTEKLKKILKSFKVLCDQEANAKNLKQVLHNQFKFKMIDPPLSIVLNTSITKKYPKQYNNFKKNYKALLTTLKIHPCYLFRIFEHKLMKSGELYNIIKMIFQNIQDDKYSQLLLVILNRMILRKTVERVKEKYKDGN